MKQYQAMLQYVLDNGELVTNGRTKEGYYSVFGYQNRYNLREGFPALTTKKLFFRGVAVEMCWFLRGDTNIKYLQDNNVHIWDEWKDQNGNIGPMYGKQLRNWEHIELVQRKTKQTPLNQKFVTSFPKEIVVDTENSTEYELLGKTIVASTGTFTVVKGYRVSRNDGTNATKVVYDVKFHETGYVVQQLPAATILTGSVKDRFAPTAVGVGCLGEGYSSKDRELLYQTWIGMLKRCYDKNHIGYTNYGARGVFVDDRWLCFANFVNDCKLIPNWLLRLEYPTEYSLDKDYYGANFYGPDSTIWLSKTEQNLNQQDSVWFRALGPNGEQMESIGVKTLCSAFGFKPIGVYNTLAQKQTTHHGWKFERLTTNNPNILPRVRKIDQIQRVIAELKHAPHSRRILASTWNVGQLDDMALNPCHGSPVQFKVSHGGTRLNCQLYQRSADAAIGVPFNIASYALLTHMVAQVTGLEVGEFVHTFGDLHIYEPHIQGVKEQLTREPLPLPKLWLNPEIKNINDFKPEDIKLIDYVSHGTIPFSVAV